MLSHVHLTPFIWYFCGLQILDSWFWMYLIWFVVNQISISWYHILNTRNTYINVYYANICIYFKNISYFVASKWVYLQYLSSSRSCTHPVKDETYVINITYFNVAESQMKDLIVNVDVYHCFCSFWYGFKEEIRSYQFMAKMLKLHKIMQNYNEIECIYI